MRYPKNRRTKPAMERFMALVRKTEYCWEWIGTKVSIGYGNFRLNGVSIGAHRASHLLFTGPIPDGLYVLHKCDNPSCVNPDHLVAGTARENVADMDRKGRRRVVVHHSFRYPFSVVLRARELRSLGMTTRKIASEIGASQHSVVQWINGARESA